MSLEMPNSQCWIAGDFPIFDRLLMISSHRIQPIVFGVETEAVAQRCSIKKLFLEISENSRENTFARVSFLIELIFNFFKKEFLTQVFSCELCESSKNTFSYRTPPVAASVQARFCGILWLSVYCVHKLRCRSNNKIKNNEVMSRIN